MTSLSILRSDDVRTKKTINKKTQLKLKLRKNLDATKYRTILDSFEFWGIS